MSDDSAKAEEERIQRAMNRKNRTSMVVQPSHRSEPFAPVNSFSPKQPTGQVKSIPEKPKPLAQEKPKPLAQEKPKPQEKAKPLPTVNSNPKISSEMEGLQLKKRTILGTIGTTRREIEEVRVEIAKLKNKEAELVSLLEKREAAVQQLSQDIEALEQKDHTEELRRKDEEKAKRVNAEIDRRRKEEEDEEKKKFEQEEEKKILNPKPIYSPRANEEEQNEDDINAEEQRIMRAMSRPGKGPAPTVGTGRASSVKQSSAVSKPAMSDADKQRIAEENRKKEDENRASQERDLQQRVSHLQQPGGVKKTFVSSQVYDFDAEVKFIADFTNFEEIPITTPIDNNFTYSVTWQVKPGFHFYMFRINGKTEINKHLPTGLAPNGSLMNKIEC